MKYSHEFRALTRHFVYESDAQQIPKPIGAYVQAVLQKKFDESIFCRHTLQTIYTFIICKYSLTEWTLNNDCKIFSPLLCFYTYILFGPAQ